MGKGEKKGKALKVVTGQGSSFEGEEKKGVRNEIIQVYRRKTNKKVVAF